MIPQVKPGGLNPIDYMILKGTFQPVLRFELRATLVGDFFGVVVQTGKQVTRFEADDAVFASVFDLGTKARRDSFAGAVDSASDSDASANHTRRTIRAEVFPLNHCRRLGLTCVRG